MSEFIFITGGARSGKSNLAVRLAKETKGKVCFIATCLPQDGEMRERVRRHKLSRPKSWKTIEEPLDLAGAVKTASEVSSCVIIDCLTLWISNLVLSGAADKDIRRYSLEAIQSVKKSKVNAIVISNEVGSGIVPDNQMARGFRDIAGEVNQAFAGSCDKAYFVVSGLPILLKGEE